MRALLSPTRHDGSRLGPALASTGSVITNRGKPRPYLNRFGSPCPEGRATVRVSIHWRAWGGYRIGLSQRFSAFLSPKFFSRDRGLETSVAWDAGPHRAFARKIAKLNTKSPGDRAFKSSAPSGAQTAWAVIRRFFSGPRGLIIQVRNQEFKSVRVYGQSQLSDSAKSSIYFSVQKNRCLEILPRNSGWGVGVSPHRYD